MNGSLIYAMADDFNVREDLWGLAARVAAEDRHRGYKSAIRLLFDLALDGFNPDQMSGLLAATDFDDVMLFEDAGVRLAFDVPGNGRHSTPDIMLLAAQFCAKRGEFDDPAIRISFIANAVDRRTRGRRAEWPLVKPR